MCDNAHHKRGFGNKGTDGVNIPFSYSWEKSSFHESENGLNSLYIYGGMDVYVPDKIFYGNIHKRTDLWFLFRRHYNNEYYISLTEESLIFSGVRIHNNKK